MLEETPTTIGQKIWRGVIGLFLSIMVLMLIITFLPGDMEQNLIDQVTGRMSTTAGKVGDRAISIDYFNAARKNCYFQYKDYAPQLASNEDLLVSCAFQTIRSVFVAGELADAFGYQVSELAIKREMSRQARELHKQQTNQAGYGEEDIRSAEDIYRSILRSEPILFKKESTTSMSLFNSFMRADLRKTTSEQMIEKEAQLAKFGLRLVSVTDAELMNVVEKELVISDEEIRSEYDKETSAGNTPKDPDGKPLSFDARKAILTNKIRLDKKTKALEDRKSLLRVKKEEGASLEELAEAISTKPISLSSLSIGDLSSLSAGGQVYRLSGDQTFLKDMSEIGFGSKKIGGPYKDGDKNIFVEFTELRLPDTKAPTVSAAIPDDKQMLAGFFQEMIASMSKENPLQRNIRMAGE
ncbi:hypothetical protein [Leptospira sp. GIMC2001]|uniref:hypothetical protein n=1 Tax=Leptospira sp. GIMC2001 TaxID=1513297 RepID=UPI002349D506|nr:hypothetical protein [Leptospira sp. GIMC2001]WCL50312.1 hypothetical protein O4O04_05695 [Leptospira sp. GIMC2001]